MKGMTKTQFEDNVVVEKADKNEHNNFSPDCLLYNTITGTITLADKITNENGDSMYKLPSYDQALFLEDTSLNKERFVEINPKDLGNNTNVERGVTEIVESMVQVNSAPKGKQKIELSQSLKNSIHFACEKITPYVKSSTKDGDLSSLSVEQLVPIFKDFEDENILAKIYIENNPSLFADCTTESGKIDLYYSEFAKTDIDMDKLTLADVETVLSKYKMDSANYDSKMESIRRENGLFGPNVKHNAKKSFAPIETTLGILSAFVLIFKGNSVGEAFKVAFTAFPFLFARDDVLGLKGFKRAKQVFALNDEYLKSKTEYKAVLNHTYSLENNFELKEKKEDYIKAKEAYEQRSLTDAPEKISSLKKDMEAKREKFEEGMRVKYDKYASKIEKVNSDKNSSEKTYKSYRSEYDKVRSSIKKDELSVYEKNISILKKNPDNKVAKDVVSKNTKIASAIEKIKEIKDGLKNQISSKDKISKNERRQRSKTIAEIDRFLKRCDLDPSSVDKTERSDDEKSKTKDDKAEVKPEDIDFNSDTEKEAENSSDNVKDGEISENRDNEDKAEVLEVPTDRGELEDTTDNTEKSEKNASGTDNGDEVEERFNEDDLEPEAEGEYGVENEYTEDPEEIVSKDEEKSGENQKESVVNNENIEKANNVLEKTSEIDKNPDTIIKGIRSLKNGDFKFESSKINENGIQEKTSYRLSLTEAKENYLLKVETKSFYNPDSNIELIVKTSDEKLDLSSMDFIENNKAEIKFASDNKDLCSELLNENENVEGKKTVKVKIDDDNKEMIYDILKDNDLVDSRPEVDEEKDEDVEKDIDETDKTDNDKSEKDDVSDDNDDKSE